MSAMSTQVQRIGELLDALHCGALLIDRSGRVLHANERMCRIADLPSERLRGRSLHEIYLTTEGRHDIDAVLSHFDEAVEREFYVPRADGSRVPVITSGRPLDGDGEPACYRIVTVIDISARKLAEQRVSDAFREVSRLSDTVLEQALELRRYSRELERRVQERTAELHEANMESIYMLAVASEAKDADTGAHVRRIQRYAQRLSEAAQLPPADAVRIGYSAILHDVGKLHVPDEILKKPGPLTPEEWVVMRQHTTNGERMLSRKAFFDQARRIARSHHEKWDGSGYPDGLEGEAIPLEARIVHLVDVYDALTNARPYKAAWPPEDAAEAIRGESRSSFDPRLVSAFLDVFKSGGLGG